MSHVRLASRLTIRADPVAVAITSRIVPVSAITTGIYPVSAIGAVPLGVDSTGPVGYATIRYGFATVVHGNASRLPTVTTCTEMYPSDDIGMGSAIGVPVRTP